MRKMDKGVAVEDVPYGRILKEGWVLIVAFALVGALGGWGLAQALPVSYRATSTLMLQVESSESSLFERNQFSLARIKTYPPLVGSQAVIDGVRRDLALSPDEISDAALRQMLSAENTEETVLLRIRAEAPSADLARDMSNSAARHLSELLERTENAGAESRYRLELQQVLPASTPQSQESPRVMAILGLGLIGGFAVGAIVAVYRTTTRRRLLTFSDVRKASGLPVVGQVARFRRSHRGDSAAALNSLQVSLENIKAIGGAEQSAYMVIPASEGVLTDDLLAGLLEAPAALGFKTCVLDLRRLPAEVEGARSWSELFDAEPDEVPAGQRGGDIYVAMDSTPSSLSAERVAAAVDKLRKNRDVVVILSDSGSSALQEQLAGLGVATLLSVRRNATTATDLIVAVNRLHVMRISPLGVLMTHVPRHAMENVAESWRTADSQRVVGGRQSSRSSAGRDLIDPTSAAERRRPAARAFLG